MMIEPIVSLAFSVYENKGVFALLLGSGVSRAAEIPTGWEMTIDLIRRVAAASGAKDEPNWEKWYWDKYHKEPNYSELLDELAGTPDERRSVIHSYIVPTPRDVEEGRKVPTKAHRAIARLIRDGYIRVVITTNFDRLLEKAIQDEGVEPTVVRSPDDLKGAVPLLHSQCFVFKVHGDYLDARIKNTQEELSNYSSEINDLLDRIIDEHGLIICGWSGTWDPALKSAIMRAPNRRYPLFWASRGKPSPEAEDLIQHRRGKVILVNSADDFFTSLQDQVSIQAEIQSPNPKSVNLLIEKTKKYLTKPEFRIQLDDLIGNEIKQLKDQVANKDFDTHLQPTPDEFRSRVARMVAISEPIVRLFGLIGRWGDGNEFHFVVKALQIFGNRKLESGFELWMKLRQFPAVLILFSYGLGVLKSEKYKILMNLFQIKIDTKIGKSKSAIECLFLGAWEEMQKSAWQDLEGLERHKTALSEYLYGLFKNWTKDYIYSEEEFTYLFEFFEILGSVAYLTITTPLERLEKILAYENPGQKGFVWAPVGRESFDEQGLEKIYNDMADDDLFRKLLDSGFSNKDAKHFENSLTSIHRLMTSLNRIW